MKVKMIKAFDCESLEAALNTFLQENEDKIEVLDIKWRNSADHDVMVLYKPINN